MQQNPRDGTKLGAYTLIRLIARGGMGEVYEAFESKLQRRVALKLIAPTNPSEHDQDELIRRFMLEARTLAKINHPNVVTIYAIDNIVDVPFIAMEYVDGVAFRELVEQFTFTADGAAPLFLQMCDGLKALHDNQIIHRDLKPHNILLRRDGQVKILDFGIAKGEGGGDQTRAGVVVGTLPYMPPEVKSGAPASPRSDLWSLGAIFFECLTGDRLVTAQAEAPKGVDVPFTKDEVSRIPPEMRAIITKMCAARPAQRFQSASEVIEELRKFRRDRPQVSAGMWEHLTKKIDEISEANKKIANAEAPRVQFTELLAKQAREDATPASGEIRDITGDRQRANAQEHTLENPLVGRPRRWWIVPAAAAALAIGFVIKVRDRIEPSPASAPAPITAAAPTSALPSAAPAPTVPLPIVPPAEVVTELPALIEPVDGKSVWLEAEQVPTFAWSRLLERGEYRIEIAGDRDFRDVRVSELVTGGSFRPSHPLDDGAYYWRLKGATDRHPTVGPARVVVNVLTPIQLGSPEAQERFVARAREDGAVVSFKWTCLPHGRRYQLEVTAFGAKSAVVDQTVSACESAAHRLAPATYRWRVRAEAITGAPPPIWSESRAFVVEAAPNAAAPVVAQTPAAAPARPRPSSAPTLAEPKLLNPVQSVTLSFRGQPRDVASIARAVVDAPKLKWRKVAGARSYVVQTSASREFARPLTEERTTGTQLEWRGVVPGRTFWRVNAVAGDVQGPFSERGQLDAYVPAPNLNNQYRVTTPALDFAPAALAERYVIQIARTRDLAQAQTQTSARPHATFTEDGGTFFVRVAAANAAGDVISSYSNLAQVDVAKTGGLRAPDLLTPPSKARAPARNGRISLIFSWDRSEGADSYVLEISNDENFRRVIERKATRDRGAVYKQAALGGRVYWRVRAKARSGYSEWSRPNFFDVVD